LIENGATLWRPAYLRVARQRGTGATIRQRNTARNSLSGHLFQHDRDAVAGFQSPKSIRQTIQDIWLSGSRQRPSVGR
jgi:hypothetical protein